MTVGWVPGPPVKSEDDSGRVGDGLPFPSPHEHGEFSHDGSLCRQIRLRLMSRAARRDAEVRKNAVRNAKQNVRPPRRADIADFGAHVAD
jgi:hypothetical protein